MTEKLVNQWTVGEYTIREVEHWTKGEENLFNFKIGDAPWSHVYYGSLDKAMLAAVCEKHTGPAMAGGPGVGSAADWFAKAIGLE